MNTLNNSQSANLFEKAKTYFPGGVNSPVRAFRSVGGTPLFMDRGQGSRVFDADGNEYIDFCCSWGPLILGHAHPDIIDNVQKTIVNGTSFGAPTRLENDLASLILEDNPFLERIRFVSSGTEAVMSAVRLARGYTGKSKIIKFEGCYHGHVDYLLVKAGSGLVTFGESSSAGVPDAFAKETIVLPLNDVEALEDVLKQHSEEIACVLIEPVPANNGLLLQDRSFLQSLRNLCDQYGVLLIFDEVISGFRVGFHGAAGFYGIAPDLICYGKIIGGGLPVGAYGGSEEIMSKISPLGPVYQAGTLSGNPVAMSAGIAQLSNLKKPGFYAEMEAKTYRFVSRLNSFFEANQLDVFVFHIGSIFWLAFKAKGIIRRAEEIDSDGIKVFNKAYHLMLSKGVYFGPSGYEVGFVSAAHTEEDLNTAASIINECILEAMKG
jgi:glutamate-1-semialdehyde 2,1-aminomutase